MSGTGSGYVLSVRPVTGPGAAYRFSGLVPTDYESAGRRRPGQHISREGSVELREAIIELGRGLAGHGPDFAAYEANKLADGEKRAIAAVTVGRRAHRLAFAMMRDQTRCDPLRWAETGMEAPAETRVGICARPGCSEMVIGRLACHEHQNEIAFYELGVGCGYGPAEARAPIWAPSPPSAHRH